MLAIGFASRLRKLREARGLTQKELAERIGLEVVQVSRYERGQYLPNAETLVGLGRVLQLDLNLLLLGEASGSARDELPALDIPLLERLRDLQKLSKRDRESVLLVLDSVLARADVESRIRKHA